MKPSSVSRRDFVQAVPLAVLLPTVLSCAGEAQAAPEEEVRPVSLHQDPRPGLSGPFTEAEAEQVAASSMAQEIAALNGQGYPCSEMMLLAALRYLGLPEKYLDAAAVFGGGVGKRDLCGLLTGGLMAIGFAAGERYEERAEMHRVARGLSNAYWDWWVSRADVHCMGPGATHETSEEFVRMNQRAAVHLEQLLRPLRST